MFLYIADQDNPNTNPNTNPNPDTQPPEQNMDEGNDRNTEILARLGALRRLSSIFRGGDQIRRSLGEALENITNTIATAHGALYNISSYRDSQR